MIYTERTSFARGKLSYPFPKQALVYTCLWNKFFEKTVGKGEIARNEQFLIFPQPFSIIFENLPQFSSNSNLSSANYFSLEESKKLCLGKG